MSVDEHKSMVRRFNDELWERGDLGVVDEMFAPDWVWHGTPPPGAPRTRDGLRQTAAAFRAAFSDTRSTIEDQIAEGDRVAWRWAFQGRHTGDLLGIPATGREVSFTGISIDRIADGRFVERWDSADMLGLLQQLGAIPTPGETPAEG